MTAAAQEYTPEYLKDMARKAYDQGKFEQAQKLDKYYQQAQKAKGTPPPPPPSIPKPRDSALQYSVDQAQKMYGGMVENVGRVFGSDSVQQYGQEVQAQQDKDIKEGGYQSQYSTFEDSWKKGGISGALGWAAEGIAENAASSGASLVGAAGTAAAAYFGAPAWAVLALGGATGINNIALNTGENVLEQKEKLGDFDAAYATGAGLLAGVLDSIGASRAIPKSKLKNMTTEQIAELLRKKGKGDAAKEFLKRMGAEGVTEMAQEGIVMGTVVAQDGNYTPEEVRTRLTDSLLLGGAMSGSINASISTAKSAANLVRGSTETSNKSSTEEQIQAKASFAKMLAETAQQENLDLTDVDRTSTKGARATIDIIHKRLVAQLRSDFKELKSRLAPTDADSLQTLQEKILANVAYEEARNKTKNTVGNQEFAAFTKLAGDTYEGQQAINRMLLLNEMTELHNNGYKAGITKITDQFAPVGLGGEGYDAGRAASELVLRPLLTTGAAAQTGGLSLVPQAAIYGGGRLIDRLGGGRGRSALARYVDANKNNEGLAPGNPNDSLRVAQQIEERARAQAEEQMAAEADQRAQEKQDANLKRAQEGAPPKLGSPEQIIRDGTGLNRSQIAQVLRILKANPNTLPDTLRAIGMYEQSIATGGSVDFDLIRDINSFVDRFGNNLGITPGTRNAQALQQGAAQQAQAKLTQQEQNYERGIRANQAFAQALIDQVNADTGLSPIQKAALIKSLSFVRSSTITQNPVQRMDTELRKLAQAKVPQEKIEQHFAPYAERVREQQAARISVQDAQDEVEQIDFSRQPFSEESRQPLNEALKERAKAQGFNTDRVFYHGTPLGANFTAFDYDKLGGAEQYGAGFYLTNNSETANMYTGNWALFKQASATVIPTYTRDANLLKVSAQDGRTLKDFLTLDQEQTKDVLLESASLRDEQGMNPFGNYFEEYWEVGVQPEMYDKLAEMQAGRDPHELQDFFDGDNESYLRALSDVTGYDGLEIEFSPSADADDSMPDGEVFQVHWKPENIRSTFASFDPRKENRSDLDAMRMPFSEDSTDNPMVISSMLPTGVPGKNTFDPNAENRQPNLANIDGGLASRIRANLIKPTPKTVKSGNNNLPLQRPSKVPQRYLRQAVEFYKSNLLSLYNSLSPEYRERAKQWYVGANKLSQEAADRYGVTLEQVAGVMSALSPQMDWYKNYDLGIKLLEMHTNAQDEVFTQEMLDALNVFATGTPKERFHKDIGKKILGKKLSELDGYKSAYFMRFYNFITNPEKGYRVIAPEGNLEGFLLNNDGSKSRVEFANFKNMQDAISILKDGSKENISASLGIGHKRRSFYNNILDPFATTGDVTIDTHAVAAAMLQPYAGGDPTVARNFKTPDSKNLGLYGTYPVYAEAYRQAAEEVGILPREMQSITWEAVRGLFTDKFKTAPNKNAIASIWNDYRRGRITLEQARESVYETAGNIKPAAWEDQTRPSFTINEGNEISTDSGELPGNRLPRGDNLGREFAGRGLEAAEEIDAMSQGALAQAELLFTTPTIPEIKNQLKNAKEIKKIILGKPLTKNFNGLRKIADLFELAEALNITVSVVDDMQTALGKEAKGALGAFVPGEGGVTGEVFVLDVDGQGGEGNFILALAHELGHALESRPQSNRPGTSVFLAGANDGYKNRPKRQVYRNSLRMKLRRQTRNPNSPIRQEIDKLQDSGTQLIGGDRPIRRTLDDFRDRRKETNPDESNMDNFFASVDDFMPYKMYIKNDAEFAVDPVLFYLVDPQGMKKEMPATFKFIQDFFNKSNIPVELHSNPFVAVLAIVLAGIAAAKKDDEEEDQGMLAMPMGMLSA